MGSHKIDLTVNGASQTCEVESRLLLVHFLRENLGLTGTHISDAIRVSAGPALFLSTASP